MKDMKVETGLVQFGKVFGDIQGGKPAEDATLKVRGNLGALAGCPEVAQTLMQEALNHKAL